MRSNRRIIALVGALALSLSLVAGACSSSDEATDESNGDKTDETAEEAPDTPSEDMESIVEARGEPEVPKAEVPTELKVIDDVKGTGGTVKPDSIVTAHYVGAAVSTGKVFESSWTNGTPFTSPLSGVIEGWTKGLVGMKAGGRRTLVIPAELAYGDDGPAPGDALIFVIDLIAVESP